MPLVPGILSVIQTPFDGEGALDLDSLKRLARHAIESGVDGLVAPAVASEVAFLTPAERERIVQTIAGVSAGRVPFIAGASSGDADVSAAFAREAERAGAAAALVAVPEHLYGQPEDLVEFFRRIANTTALPLLVQDLQWNGPGLDIDTIRRLRDAVPTLAGLKIETVPAGPKYTLVKRHFGSDFFVAGGWAVPQMIEALDRGVDAMIPESSMIPVYAAIWRDYNAGRRQQALERFHRLLPVLSFTNQEIRLSIAFFKLLLVTKGILASDRMRWPGFEWDPYNRRIAEELIGSYLTLEHECSR